MSRKKKKGVRWVPVENWKEELQAGDVVKLTSGTGPYSEINGQRHMVGAGKGVYTVHAIIGDGIYAYEINSTQREFLYMGLPYISKGTGTIMEAYKLRKKVVIE